MCFIYLHTAWDIFLYLNHLSYTKDVFRQSILISTMCIWLCIGVYVRFDFNGLGDPKPLVDSSTFEVIYRVGNFDASKRICLVYV